MRNNLSIISRTMLFVSVAITMSMITLLFLIESSIKSHFLYLDDEMLEDKVATIKLLSNSSDPLNSIIDWDKTNVHSNLFIKIVKNKKEIYKGVSHSLAHANASDTLIHPIEVSMGRASLHNYLYRNLTFQNNNESYSVFIYLDSTIHSHFISDFRVQLLIIIVGVWMITFISTYLGIRQGHKPIYNLSKHISTIQTEKLNSTLMPSQYPKELRELVISFNEMLFKLNQSFIKLTDFSDDVAHELRTPLTNIITQAQVYLNKDRTIEEYKESLCSILDELERLTKMVNDMLWISRSDKGLTSTNKEIFNAAEDVSSVLDFFIYLAEDKNIRFKVLNKCDIAFADRDMFRRAISNLISNAIKYSEDNSTIEIGLSLDERNDFIFEIKNQCYDISHDDAQKMFERFYCKKTALDNNNDSIGLGLSIVKAIADLNGGVAWNKVSDGYISFYLLFPANEG